MDCSKPCQHKSVFSCAIYYRRTTINIIPSTPLSNNTVIPMTNKMLRRLYLLCLHTIISTTALAADLPTTPDVDLTRYQGRWYEIARLPNRFQEICAGDVYASYTLQKDGNVEVANTCRKTDGSTTSAIGLARLASGPQYPGRLEVRFAPAWLSFLPMVWGDYWIIDLAPDYSTSLVGSPDRRFLWLLSRTPQMDKARIQTLLDKARVLGFATEQLITTPQASQ